MDIGQGRGFFVLTGRWCWPSRWRCCTCSIRAPGRAIRSLKGGAQMAEAMGISTFRYKVDDLRDRRAVRVGVGLAVRAFPAHRQPDALRPEDGHRVPVHGGGRRRRPCLGRDRRRGVTKLLDDQLQVLLPQLIGTSGSYEVIVFGIVLVLMLKYQPDGLWDFVERRLPRAPRAVDWADAPRAAGARQAGARRAAAGRAGGAQAIRRPGRRQRRQLPDPRRRDRRPDRDPCPAPQAAPPEKRNQMSVAELQELEEIKGLLARGAAARRAHLSPRSRPPSPSSISTRATSRSCTASSRESEIELVEEIDPAAAASNQVERAPDKRGRRRARPRSTSSRT